MLDSFKEHFDYTPKEFRALWDNGIFCLDANVLLNFYRYSDQAREDLTQELGSLGERLWIPHRAAYEFFNNRLNVIVSQEKAYTDMIDTLNKVKSELKNKRQHPFIQHKTFQKLEFTLKLVIDELKEAQKMHSNRLLNDPIKIKLGELLDKKIGPEFSQDRIEELSKVGQSRFQNKIPPGYKDQAKSEDKDQVGYRKYGDFFIWMQILEKSKSDGKGVVLITDDRKEDWWEIFRGKNLGPRKELLKEFKEFTGCNFYMYQTHKFLEFSSEFLNRKVNRETINELREIRVTKEPLISRNGKGQEDLAQKKLKLSKEIEWIEHNVETLRNFISEIELKSDPSDLEIKKLPGYQSELHEKLIKLDILKDEQTELMMKINESEPQN